MKIKRAIVSVSDKTGLIPLAKQLAGLKVEIFSTGGTLALLKKEKIKARSVSELTGFPEILDGRVKTLHPKVHGGLLFLRTDAKQKSEAKKHHILPIDLVVVNLYPFAETIQKPGVTLKEAVEQIDIGGPSMLRSASKNFESVAVVSDPMDYPAVITALGKGKGTLSLKLRHELAAKAFRHTSAYDRQIAHYLSEEKGTVSKSKGDLIKELPAFLDGVFKCSEILRYGENPHQRAALYRRADKPARFSFTQIQGKALSYNNILDFESAVDILREFKEPAVCVVKHSNPCGVASHDDLTVAAMRAIEGDPLSAFGGIVGINRPCDEALAKLVFEKLSFFEIILAPEFSKRAVSFLSARKNLRIIQIPYLYEIGPYDLRFAKSGVLLQDRDLPIWKHEEKLRKHIKWVTREKLRSAEMDDVLFAWKCVKVVKSNAIVLTQGKQTVGIGGGQMSRVDSVRLACWKAGERSKGSILASDGFFPMPDNIEVAFEHGVRAVVQPGGSIRDKDVIEACDRLGIAMAFTGERHFKH